MTHARSLATLLVLGFCTSICTSAAVAQDGWLCGTNDESPDARKWLALSSGIRMKTVSDTSVPLVSFHVRLPGGSLSDTPELAGRSALLAEWASRGAAGMSAEEFRRAVESRGGSLSVNAGSKWIAIDAEFLAEDALYGLDLVFQVVRAPTLDPVELRKARDLAVEEVKLLRTDPNNALRVYWDAWLFGDHAYGSPLNGDEGSLTRAADPAALKRRWAEIARPENTWLVVGGDFSAPVLRGALGKLYGAAHRVPAVPIPVPTAAPIKGGRVLLVDHPGALQTYFRFGGPGLPRDDPDHAARYIANTLLGGRFTSRLNTALRIDSGLTYGARSRFDDSRGGAFAVSTYTQTATSKECIDLAQKVYGTFVTTGITADELDSARAYVKGQFAPDEMETPAQRAAWMLDLAISGMSFDFIDGFFARLDALTLDDVNRVITERFPREDLCWVVIGQADALRPVVERLGKVTEVKLSAPGFGPRK